MKIVRFSINNNTKYGILEDNKVYEMSGNILEEFEVNNKDCYEIDSVKLEQPCIPSKIVCVGLNYIDHIKEMGMKEPNEPTIFLKPPTSVIGHNEEIIYPENVSQLDYEGEVGVVIKNKIKNIEPKEAKNYILGYTCGNDVTARDLQKKDGQWTRAKSFDTFCPIGPVIETEADHDNLKIETYLNGELKQASNTSFLLFSINHLVSYISKIMTLSPFDIILTGTPSGVGPMSIGDEVTVNIEGIGSLRNIVL